MHAAGDGRPGALYVVTAASLCRSWHGYRPATNSCRLLSTALPGYSSSRFSILIASSSSSSWVWL